MAEPEDTREERDEDAGARATEPADETLARQTAPLDGRRAGATDDPTEEARAAGEAGGDTVRRPLVSVDEPAAEEMDEKDGARGTGPVAWARAHVGVVVALGVVAVAVIGLLVVALVNAAAVPDEATIVADARSELPAPSCTGGTYGTDGVLVTSGVDVRSVTRTDAAPDGSAARFGASGYATAEVVVTFSGQGVSADQAAALSYALVDGTWERIGAARADSPAWHATAGVDQEKVTRNAKLLLQRADAAQGWDGSDGLPTLEGLYADAPAAVTSEAFDEQAQTDVVELSLERAGRYETYACTLRATFSFASASGRWEVSSVEVDDAARTPDLSALVGTWTGTFQRQDTEGTKCLAGRAAGLTVNVERASAEGGAPTISGTISALAHYHAHPGQDSASCDGDLAFEDVPFTASLAEDEAGSELAFSATLPEDVGGTVDLALGFGTGDNAGQVVARVRTTYPHTASFLFIPYDETLTYTDVFTLAHEG